MEINLYIFLICAFVPTALCFRNIEVECVECVRNGTFGFYKSVWLPIARPDYFCQLTAEKKQFGIIVEQACTVAECKMIHLRPLTKFIEFWSKCNASVTNNSTIANETENSTELNFDHPALVNEHDTSVQTQPENSGHDIISWIAAGAAAALFIILQVALVWTQLVAKLWYDKCTWKSFLNEYQILIITVIDIISF